MVVRYNCQREDGGGDFLLKFVLFNSDLSDLTSPQPEFKLPTFFFFASLYINVQLKLILSIPFVLE